jgi:hypothetical protein
MNFCTSLHLQTTKLESLHAAPLVHVVNGTAMLTSLVVKQQEYSMLTVTCISGSGAIHKKQI